jgi:hypothetical protein
MLCSYVLPLRWAEDAGRLSELTSYLRSLSEQCEVIVVDGSPGPVHEQHALAWSGLVQHCRPDPDLHYLNGKVNGVVTGVRRSTCRAVVIADDDVRYDVTGLRRLVSLLREGDLVVPQNYFDPAPWHARWDTGRSLLNRAVGTDYPGTVAIRQDAWSRTGGYDGDVLFENLELIRTVRAAGGSIVLAPEVFVRRIPPAASGFRSQRVRQAYDSFAQPARLVAELLALPTVLGLAGTRRFRALIGVLAAVIAVAETGRRRAGGRQVFDSRAALWAPLWVLERAVCSWVAVGRRLVSGGVPYSGGLLRTAAHSMRELERLQLGTSHDGRAPASAWRETVAGGRPRAHAKADRVED